jgi:formylglycine-generating enzyme
MVRVPRLAAPLVIALAAFCGCQAVYDLSALGPAEDDAADAGADGFSAADAAAADGPRACPAGEGPPMVSAGSFCIDATEVTNAQYARFLQATTVTRPLLPASCAFKTTLTPAQDWPAAPEEQALPVRHVDWCDALSYCLWTNKRLCGRLGTGGALRAAESVDPLASEWAFACTGGTAQSYPYGATYEVARCNTGSDVRRTASASTCEGAVPGLLDLVGNVAEWLDACETSDGAFDECRVAGGSFLSAGADAKCSSSAPAARGAARADQGIRCCSP